MAPLYLSKHSSLCVLSGCCFCLPVKIKQETETAPLHKSRRSKPFTLDSNLAATFHVDKACSHENLSHSIASQTGLLRESPLESCFSSFLFPFFYSSSFSSFFYLPFHVSSHPTLYPTLTHPPMHTRILYKCISPYSLKLLTTII